MEREDRLDKLEKATRAVKNLYDDDKEHEYNAEVVAIYSDPWASWERGLEDVVFSRVIQRHRDYIDTKLLKRVSILTEAECDLVSAGFKRCCEIVESHDPSRGRNATPPALDEILKDIWMLKDWVKELRDRQRRSND